MSRGCSHVVLTSEKARELAEACLAAIAERRVLIRLTDIAARQRELDESRFERFCRKWFKTPVPTPQEIEDQLRAVWRSVYCAPPWETYKWEQKEIAERIILAAKHADNVVVSLTDLEMIALQG